MEEKKLTDDTEINVGMIENALKCLAGQKACDLCVYDDLAMQDGERTCINLVAEDTLDLIHRLQEENKGLKERGEIVINSLHETIDEQKAEIERLKDEKYKVEQNLKQCENGYELELHTERFELRSTKEKVAEFQKQAVKDTAKDIITMLRRRSHQSIERHIIHISKKFGVEVE